MPRYEPKPIPRHYVPKLVPGVFNDPSNRLTRKLPVSHAYIASAYYYPKSSSLGDNAIALNMVVDSVSTNIDQVTYKIVGSNETQEKMSIALTQAEPSKSCRYVTAVALTNNLENLTKIEIESEEVRFEVPFKTARYNAPKPVIFCISPQSLAEQWQFFLMNVHISRRFGAHIHIYVTSIIESYFELMKEYENHGYITMDYWLRMKFSETASPYFEPNINTERANRAGAYTDCLLQYKEAAKYIAFMDLEDFLFPIMRTSFLREFSAEFEYQMTASSIYYPGRDYKLIKAEYLAEFSFYDTIESLESLDASDEKGVVIVKPQKLNSTRIPWMGKETVNDRYSVENNWVVRIQPHGFNTTTQMSADDTDSFSGRIRPRDLAAIEEDIWKMRNLTKVNLVSVRLPRFDFYTPILSKCLSDSVNKNGEKNCPSAEGCELPQRDGFRCAHSDAEYISSPHMVPFTFHFANNSFWSYNIGCFQ